MICPYCGGINADDAKYCSHCGKRLVDDDTYSLQPITDAISNIAIENSEDNHSLRVKCPRCGSYHLQALSENTVKVSTTGGGYSLSKGLLGWLVLGPWGILLGNGGHPVKTQAHNISKLFWICSECGMRFRNLDEWEKEIQTLMNGQKFAQYAGITFGIIGILFLLGGGIVSLFGGLLTIMGVIYLISSWGLKIKIEKENKEFQQLKENSTE